jgi:hypothetical protein
MRSHRRGLGWQAGIGNLAAVLVLYFAVPISSDLSVARLIFRVVLTLAAVALIGFFVFRVSVVGREGPRLRPLRPVHLILALEGVLVVFAMLYYTLAVNTDDQMSGITTRLDALYFTTVTLGTVGFGDITAKGQLARGLVTAQILFDVGFLAAFAAVFRGILTTRLEAVEAERVDEDPED